MNRTRQKMVQKHIEVTDYENKALKALMEKGGYRKEAHLIRDLIMNTIPIELPKETFDALTTELHKIGVNINQIAHVANAIGLVNANEYAEEAKKLDELCFTIQKSVLEPFQRREVDDLIHDLQWYDFGDLDRNMRSIEIRSELISMLNARDRECEELGSN